MKIMKKYEVYWRRSIGILGSTLIWCFMFFGVAVYAQSAEEIAGAWEMKDGDKTSVLVFQDNYFTESVFKSDEYVKSYGGPYLMKNGQLEVVLEFDSEAADRVGSPLTVEVSVEDDQLKIIKDGKTQTWRRTDAGDAPLAGVWHITERMQDGDLVAIHQRGTRKTLKVLTGNRFQWFAIDPGTKQFSGTGGGTYTFENGKYTEHIEFFSRDNSRVGASLSFDGELKNGKWHHSGLSSKGDKIYEVWSRVE